MKSFLSLRKLTISALFLALGVALPWAFHFFGMAGRIFLPMHWAVVIGGCLLGPWWGALIGLLCPVMNFLVSGFPRFPSLLLMTPEMLTYGLLAGLFVTRWGYKSYWQMMVALIPALIGGRLVYGIAAMVFGPLVLGINQPLVYIGGALASGIPGVLMMLVLIPALVTRIQKVMPSLFSTENSK
jgi:niacin transporter